MGRGTWAVSPETCHLISHHLTLALLSGYPWWRSFGVVEELEKKNGRQPNHHHQQVLKEKKALTLSCGHHVGAAAARTPDTSRLLGLDGHATSSFQGLFYTFLHFPSLENHFPTRYVFLYTWLCMLVNAACSLCTCSCYVRSVQQSEAAQVSLRWHLLSSHP